MPVLRRTAKGALRRARDTTTTHASVSCYTPPMTKNSRHTPSPDAAAKKAKKAERLAKGKYQTKLQGASRRDAKDQMRRRDE